MPMAGGMRVRESTEADLVRIHIIYTYHVRTGLGSFEEVPPDRLDAADLRVVQNPIMVVEMEPVVKRVGEDERAPPRDQERRQEGWQMPARGCRDHERLDGGVRPDS